MQIFLLDLVWNIDLRDGRELGRCPLTTEPVLDGLAAAYGRLYVTGVDGSVTCLEGRTAVAQSASLLSHRGVTK